MTPGHEFFTRDLTAQTRDCEASDGLHREGWSFPTSRAVRRVAPPGAPQPAKAELAA